MKEAVHVFEFSQSKIILECTNLLESRSRLHVFMVRRRLRCKERYLCTRYTTEHRCMTYATSKSMIAHTMPKKVIRQKA